VFSDGSRLALQLPRHFCGTPIQVPDISVAVPEPQGVATIFLLEPEPLFKNGAIAGTRIIFPSHPMEIIIKHPNPKL
jgi:hypothetical protein